ncbi:MAG: histidine kinase [Bacteroidales bacterium]|nr:histidine kinase [Bacteroidales bacterium]
MNLTRGIVKMLQSSIFHQILFWGLSFFILLNIFSISGEISTLDYIYTFLFHIGLFVAVYLNYLILIPYFLKREKYILYGVLIVACILLSAEITSLVFSHMSDLIFPGYYIVIGLSFSDIVAFQIVYIVLTSLLELSSAWFKLAESEKKLMKIEQEKISMELKALKSQLNPHFLFNSLNNLYSLSLKKSDKAPDMILRLSSLMRYILYESSQDYVPLQNEIDCVIDYLEIQNLRIEDSEPGIHFDLRGEVGEKQIAPLIFLPLVENAFKHGMKGSVDTRFIYISMDMDDTHLIFNIKNNKGTAVKVKSEIEGGIGLENIRKRLNLIYPNRHIMNVGDSKLKFEVELKIQLN